VGVAEGSPWVGGMVRVLISAGFKRMVLLVEDGQEENSDSLELINHYSQRFFDLGFQVLPNSKLVLQRPIGSLLFNVLSQEQMDQGMNNLHFLNFLGKGSIVINYDVSAEVGLLQEAHELGLSLLSFEDLYLEILKLLSLSEAKQS
jgi:hypothetical protein